ncbi:MAG: mechanosensitive ion channel family protein, partial [Pseudomonadota bacterium]
MEWIVSSLFNVVFAGVILIAGFLVASWARRLIIDLGDRRDDLDDTAYRLLGDAAKYAIIAATVIAVLARFGVATASLVAALAVAGLALGLAIQGALSHIAAGVMLMIFRPFKTGDMVEA